MKGWGFNSQHPCGISELSETPVAGDLTQTYEVELNKDLSASCGHETPCHWKTKRTGDMHRLHIQSPAKLNDAHVSLPVTLSLFSAA